MRLAPLILPYLLVLACAPRPVPSAAPIRAEISTAEAVVQAQLEAYNRRDLDAFLATYAGDVKIYDHPDQLRMSGVEQMRARYGQLFAAAPQLHATVGRRIVQGDHVIDHETVSGIPGGETIQAIAVYQVRNGRIQNVWFIR